MSTGSSESPPPPNVGDAVPQPPGRRRQLMPLRRSSSDRYLAGVAGGVSERFDLDPIFLRIGLVAAGLLLRSSSYALVPLVYVALWLLLPSDRERPLIASLRSRPAQQETAFAVVALIVSLAMLGRDDLLIPGILLGLALMLLGRRPVEGPFPIADEAAAQTDDLIEPDARGARWGRARRGAHGSALWLRGDPDRQARAHRTRREPALWPMTLALLFALLVGTLILDSTLAGGIDPGYAVNMALIGIGAVIMLSGWRGRAKLTALLLVPLLPFWVAFSVADVGRFTGDGVLRARPAEAAESQLVYQRGYGALDLDLTRIELEPGTTTTVSVDVTAGGATVMVPRGVDLEVRAHIGLGSYLVTAPSLYRSDGEPAMDRTVQRSYPALGTECVEWAVPQTELAFIAGEAAITIPAEAEADAVAQAIEDAGFPAPALTSTEIFSNDFGELYLEDGQSLFHDGGPLPDNIDVYDIRGEPVSPTSVQRTDYWTFSSDESGQLCRPEPAPPNPAQLIIIAEVGLGSLEITRV